MEVYFVNVFACHGRLSSTITNTRRLTQPPSGQGRSTLRTYRQFKSNFGKKAYLMNIRKRSVFVKFCCGVAPVAKETGRFEGLPLEKFKRTYANWPRVL